MIIPTVSVTVSLNELPVELQIVTGDDVSVIPKQLYKQSLIGPSQDSLLSATLFYKGGTVKESIYVVRGLRKTLIGRFVTADLSCQHS